MQQSMETINYLFVGRSISGMNEDELAAIDVYKLRHLHVGSDLFVGFSLPQRASQDEIATAMDSFFELSGSEVGAKVYQISVVTSVSEVTNA